MLGPNSVTMSLLLGHQMVVPNKRPEEPAKKLQMSMALFRFKNQQADFLLTLNSEIEDPNNSVTLE